ncbi:hypothetical protein [Natranaerobius thermophilus]|uniref:Uncharacterized protein n=1 Tax=Natranaerobius thermophilus (strain ATCC BAA-1301 / DSM 18059 / JW/NM-WN-LF) TaxID=457570 RepID=B2A4J1_NATTJ|nr:hypothetical protein [Natranaerobius thermophilus]ACB85168.1 hypothetical protein Nther_1594 [Natranaerobius thermophilus JW/NM-WN-LF]
MDIVFATIEAESKGKNITGDNGRAFGYGQVWLKWHYNKLKKVAELLGRKIPTKPTNIEDEHEFTKVILEDDELSMYLAVETIKELWNNSCGWEDFLKKYVGPAIPSSEQKRRSKILKKYQKVY